MSEQNDVDEFAARAANAMKAYGIRDPERFMKAAVNALRAAGAWNAILGKFPPYVRQPLIRALAQINADKRQEPHR